MADMTIQKTTPAAKPSGKTAASRTPAEQEPRMGADEAAFSKPAPNPEFETALAEAREAGTGFLATLLKRGKEHRLQQALDLAGSPVEALAVRDEAKKHGFDDLTLQAEADAAYLAKGRPDALAAFAETGQYEALRTAAAASATPEEAIDVAVRFVDASAKDCTLQNACKAYDELGGYTYSARGEIFGEIIASAAQAADTPEALEKLREAVGLLDKSSAGLDTKEAQGAIHKRQKAFERVLSDEERERLDELSGKS